MTVLHMYGSHPTSCDRTRGEYDEFIKSEELSCYNKTIKKLDAFLENVHSALNKTHESFCMIYFSDHGLMIEDNYTLVHSSEVKEAYNIPLLLWSSDIDSTIYVNEMRTSRDFLHLFTEVLGVRTSNIERDYNFISEDKNNNRGVNVFKGYKNAKAQIQFYDSLKDNSTDELFEP